MKLFILFTAILDTFTCFFRIATVKHDKVLDIIKTSLLGILAGIFFGYLLFF